MDEGQRKRLKTQLAAAKALQRVMSESVVVANHVRDVWRFSSYRTFMAQYNKIVQAVDRDCRIEVPYGMWDLDKVPHHGKTFAMQQKEFFDKTYGDLSMLIAFLDEYLDTRHDERTALRDFFQANLRRCVFREPELESEVQDAVESLLIGKGFQKPTDYDRERGRVRVSIKEAVPDFNLPRISMALEVKLSKTKTKSKEIVDEINADIQAYSKAYATLLFVVYDLGTIQDEAEFKSGIETDDADIQVVIIKH